MSAIQWGLAAAALGVPFGVQMDENLDRNLPSVIRMLRKVVLQRASFVAARSPAAVDLAIKWGARGNIGLVPHHVSGWDNSRRTSNDDLFTIGYAGRLVAEKGLDTLVDATRLLGRNVELVVAGDGPLRSWLESADLGEASLRMICGIDHAAMGDVYTQMDVLVLPSRTTPTWAEQFGRVLVEAMSCGTPVVGSSSGSIPWVLSVTGGGEVFPEGDAEALAQALESFRTNPMRRRSLAKVGQHRVSAIFGVSAVADEMEKMVREVTHRRWRALHNVETVYRSCGSRSPRTRRNGTGVCRTNPAYEQRVRLLRCRR